MGFEVEIKPNRIKHRVLRVIPIGCERACKKRHKNNHDIDICLMCDKENCKGNCERVRGGK